MRIPIEQARWLILGAQDLDDRRMLRPGKAGALQTLSHLGYVQIDTISVVERAHHHVLWTRCADYHPALLDELLVQDRAVWEYWTHAASYVPMADYRYYHRRMRAHADSPRNRAWLSENAEVVEEVLRRIRAEGALTSADFQAPAGFQRGTWWHWKPAKRALEILFSAGELMVSARRNFQRVYDLAERVLPPGIETTPPRREEVARFALRQALRAHGLLHVKDIRGWLASRGAIEDAAAELVAEGEVVPVEIDGQPDGDDPSYALVETMASVERSRGKERKLHILSPFDNLIIWRRRLQRLFGFDYALECYLPAAKRRHGYFVLPVLWGNRFLARLDAKAERQARRLVVKRLQLEPGWQDDEAFLPALGSKLRDYAAFNGCNQVELQEIRPAQAQVPLQRALDAVG